MQQHQWRKKLYGFYQLPAYLQDLFYKNGPEEESAFDLTTGTAVAKKQNVAQEKAEEEQKLRQYKSTLNKHPDWSSFDWTLKNK